MKLTGRLRKGKRRREPRFWVEASARHSADGRLTTVSVTIRNDADVPHRVDEALVRYDDGRVGYQLPLNTQLVTEIPAHESVTFEIPAASLLDPVGVTRFRVVTYRGKSGQRQEWSSKEERLTPG